MLASWSIVQCVVSRAFVGLRARSDVRNNRGYTIAQYVISNRRPMLNNRKLPGPYKSVRCNRVYVLSESVIAKFYCTFIVELSFSIRGCYGATGARSVSFESVMLQSHSVLLTET